MDEWFREWFGPLYEELYSHRDPDEAARQVASLLSWTGSVQGRVLDAGCGSGRHLRCLRDRGCEAVGVDLSEHLLTRARSGDAGPVVRADLRHPPFREGSFGLVASFFTVFGYLDTALDDADLFATLASLVAPGGWFFQDLPNPSHVRSTLVARDERPFGNGRVVQERVLDGDRVVKTILVESADRAGELYLEKVRLWEMHDIDRLAETAGLRKVAVMGTSDGSPATPDSPRQAVLWMKP